MSKAINGKKSKRSQEEKFFNNFSDVKVFLNQNDSERIRVTGTKKKIFKKKETEENVIVG